MYALIANFSFIFPPVPFGESKFVSEADESISVWQISLFVAIFQSSISDINGYLSLSDLV